MYPQADIPMLQLSLRAGFDPAAHIKAGRALAPLRDEGVLIIGSGSSYHNLRAFGAQAQESSKRFDDWLQQAVESTGEARNAALIDWERAPAARLAHPQEEHLLPLMVAVGAAESEATTVIYHENTFFGGVTASSFRFG
jgi:aromatic ring-opening dioxygenase catalytic subunit (LigB family)